jgi:uncharacterized MnhB-related membrane protein
VLPRLGACIMMRDLFHAIIMAAVIGAPFAIYFWSMTP